MTRGHVAVGLEILTVHHNMSQRKSEECSITLVSVKVQD